MPEKALPRLFSEDSRPPRQILSFRAIARTQIGNRDAQDISHPARKSPLDKELGASRIIAYILPRIRFTADSPNAASIRRTYSVSALLRTVSKYPIRRVTASLWIIRKTCSGRATATRARDDQIGRGTKRIGDSRHEGAILQQRLDLSLQTSRCDQSSSPEKSRTGPTRRPCRHSGQCVRRCREV